MKEGKFKLISSIILLFPLFCLLVYGLISTEFISPSDGYYLIKGGAVMGNITFEINVTPTVTRGAFANATLWTNISGTWSSNYTNDTTGTVNTETNRIFKDSDTSIYSADLVDGSHFIWNVYACDNVTSTENETVILDGNSEGNLVNFNDAVIAISEIRNTSSTAITGACNLTASTGKLDCNSSIDVLDTIYVDYTHSSCNWVGANRTLYIEDAPDVTLSLPSDNGALDDDTVTIELTVTGDDSTYLCAIYSNDTGSWAADGGSTTYSNNTKKNTTRVFTTGNIVWNARCHESSNSNIYGWAVDNRTVTVITSNPTITLNSPADNSYSNSASNSFNFTPTGISLDSCILYANFSGTYSANETITGFTSGSYRNVTKSNSEGNYIWSVFCNDSSARTGSSSNYTLTIDTTYPSLPRNINYSKPGTSIGFTVEFNFTEAVNVTFTYGTSSMAQTHKVTETDFATNQTVEITFNTSYETDFYCNISFYDRAGNRNDTISEMTIASPISLPSGWSLWSIYDSAINMSDLYTDSHSDYIYYWNNTGQSWIYHSSSGTGHASYDLTLGDVAHFYTRTNETYFRNNSGATNYHTNITGGHVYLGLYHAYSFGNLSHGVFRNSSGGNYTDINNVYGSGGKEFQIDYLSAFNNTAQSYVSSIYTWSWNNDTTLGKGYTNGLDSLWIYSDYNITVNVTPGGQVFGNWT